MSINLMGKNGQLTELTGRIHTSYVKFNENDFTLDENKIVSISDLMLEKIDGIKGFATLTAGSTTITVINPKFTETMRYTVYANVYGVSPESVIYNDGSVELEYTAQGSDVQIIVVGQEN